MADAGAIISADSSTPAMLFILSTGRSGTKTIADHLSAFSDCICLHEPEPRLVFESSLYRYGRLGQKELVTTLQRSRPINRAYRIYGESNQILSLIIPGLQEAFPTARYIWLIRNGIDVVASAVGRNWYTGRSMDGKAYDQCSPIEQEWIDGRIQGDLCGDAGGAEWKIMTPFEKCCWYWAYINRLIEHDLQLLIHPSAFVLLKLEDLENSSSALAGWIGLDAENCPLIPHQNRAHYTVYSPQRWSNSEWQAFERWCGSLMDRLYPSWRQSHQYHRRLAAAEFLLERDQVAEAKKLLDGICTDFELDARGYNTLGILQLKSGDPQAARLAYEAAVTKEPENVCFLLNLADLLFVSEHRAQEAAELYSIVLKREPSNTQALLNKLVACLSLGRTQEAKELKAVLNAQSTERPEVTKWLQGLRENPVGPRKANDTEPVWLPSDTDKTSSTAGVNVDPISGSLPPSPRTEPQTVISTECGRREADLKDLTAMLKRIGWFQKLDRYREVFSEARKLRVVEKPRISIVFVTSRPHPETVKSLEILQQQRQQSFEVIFVDNGSPAGSSPKVEAHIDTYVRLNSNTGVCLARNIGAAFARAPILFFLDDDGIPADDIVSAHLKAHEDYDVIAVRGACLPKDLKNRFNILAKNYYLGDQPFPMYNDLEGNSSYRADAFFSVGGWDDNNRMFGEGLELSRRLLNHEPDWCKQIYSPGPLLRQDYARDHAHLQQKLEIQREQRHRDKKSVPSHVEFQKQWQRFYLRADLLARKGFPPETSASAARSAASTISATGRPTLVSVIIPTHNRCRLLKTALDSALSQTGGNYEVIVVDDGSTDETQGLIRSLACDRLKYRKKSRSGAPDTRNHGIGIARGEYILWLDDDDLLSADTVATHSAVVARHPETDVVYGVLHVFDDRTGKQLWMYDPKDWSIHCDDLLSSMVAGNCIPNGGTMVRRSCYERVGCYDSSFPRAHDYEFWTRAAGHLKFRKNYKIVYRYRIHRTNMSARAVVDRSFESRIIRRMVAQYGLKRIYHWLEWKNTEAAHAAALYAVSCNLFKIGDLYNSAVVLEQIPSQLWTPDIAELSLDCMLYRGRWEKHADVIEAVKERNIIAPQGIKRLLLRAEQYWRFINGIRLQLAQKDLTRRVVDANALVNENSPPLSPDCAVKLANHLLSFTNSRNVSFSSSMSFKLLQQAVMSEPENEAINQQIQNLPITKADRDRIESIRKRILTDWENGKNNLSPAAWASQGQHAQVSTSAI